MTRLSRRGHAIRSVRALDGDSQMLVNPSYPSIATMNATTVGTEDVKRTGDRIGCNGQARRKRLYIDQAECVGPAGEYEHVGGTIG